MAQIVVTRPLVDGALEGLASHHDVTVGSPPSGDGLSEQSLIDRIGDARAIITTVADPITADVVAGCPGLEVIAQYGVGLDNVDLNAAAEADITVTHTPGVLTDATADFTWALLLAVGRRVLEADAFVREGHFERWETRTILGMELAGKTLGIIGLGRIGAAVARRALGFGMDVIFYNRSPANPTVIRESGATPASLETVLTSSDVVSLHCPHNEDSHHLLDLEALNMMRPEALLINTARGPVIKEADLVEALDAGMIAGAGLDVFEEEPDVHPGLMNHDRVVLAPHLASATVEARIRMGQMCVESLLAYFDGEDVPHRAR
ncbi:D-glycerate dehydrogenase [Longibacter salinarum]|uniref:D-glycerate dehydrogenase n=1 Tax=Longibacter salinarum TaxID=1850348 RepID=A0A2A8D152_9BACT|nr:D-glycerate dehydrogenase [Longibacter salinarum]PEN14533.1 D-glycerate dehydrogenase [Longibacter salinarum]